MFRFVYRVSALLPLALLPVPSCAADAPVAASPQPVTFEQLAAVARPNLEALVGRAELDERERVLSATGGFLLNAPTVGVEAGSRRASDAATGTDRGVEVDFPLLFRPGLRRDASRAFRTEAPLAGATLRLEARQRLREAYLDAWLAQEWVALRRSEMDSLTDWRRIVARRVESGADPPFQAALVDGEWQRTQLGYADALQQQATAWGALRVLVELPENPVPLADPGDAVIPADADMGGAFRQGILHRLAESRMHSLPLESRLQSAANNARWSLRATHAREGEERITGAGIVYRFGRPGEYRAAGNAAASAEAAARRSGEYELAALESRYRAAVALRPIMAEPGATDDFRAPLAAIDLRLREGKERASEAIPVRRQLLEARASLLERRWRAHRLNAEWTTLTATEIP